MENNNSEHEDDFVQIQERIPNSHILIYRDQEYPINFELLKYSSKYFYDHQNEIMCNNRIELVNYDPDGNIPDLSPSSIETFIKYINREQIRLTNENISTLNYLAHKYEMDELIRSTERYIERHPEACLSILTIHQNDGQISTGIYETIIARNLNDYINNEEMLDLQVPTIYRILAKNTNEINLNEKIEKNNFLLKTLDKYGREASALFEFADLDDQENDFFEILLDKYIDVFDFSFIGSAVLSELLKEREKRKTERKMHEEDKRSLEENHNRLKKQQMLAIENLKHEILERENQEKIVFKEHQSEKNELNKKIEEINMEKEGLMKEINKLNEENIDLKKEITKLRGELEDKQKVEEMQNQAHQAEVNKLNENIEQINKEKEELKTKVQKLNNKNIEIDDLKREINELRIELENEQKEEKMSKQMHQPEVIESNEEFEQIKEKVPKSNKNDDLDNDENQADDDDEAKKIKNEKKKKKSKKPSKKRANKRKNMRSRMRRPSNKEKDITTEEEEEKSETNASRDDNINIKENMEKGPEIEEEEEDVDANVSENGQEEEDSNNEKLIKNDENNSIVNDANNDDVKEESAKEDENDFLYDEDEKDKDKDSDKDKETTKREEVNNSKEEENPEQETVAFKDVNGISYEISLKSQTASVSEAPKVKTSIEIPQTVRYHGQLYGVTNINDGAFSNTEIEELFIPSSFTTLSPNWCSGATKLAKIIVDQGNNFFHIDRNGFLIYAPKQDNDHGPNERREILFAPRNIKHDYYFPNEITRFGNYAFFKREELEQFKYNSSPVKKIEFGDFCFSKSKKLWKLEIECEELKIGSNCFKDCTSLSYTSFKNLKRVTICANAFMNCTKLISICFNSSFKIDLFDNCLHAQQSLQSISLTTSELSIGNECFTNCNNLSSISLCGLNKAKIGVRALAGCVSLEKFELTTRSELEIGDFCFSGAKKLHTVDIKYNDKLTFGQSCFENCPALFSVSIKNDSNVNPVSDQSFIISSNPFAGCKSLTNVTLTSNSTLNLFSKSFKDLYTLQSVELTGNKIIIGDNCFENCFNIQKKYNDKSPRNIIIKSASLVEIGNQCFKKSGYLESVEITGMQINIKKESFLGCISLSSFSIPNLQERPIIGIKNDDKFVLGENCFEGCSSLSKFVCEKLCKARICKQAFKGCNKLEEFSYTHAATVIIEDKCFVGLNNLKSILIQSDVVNLNNNWISNCLSVYSVTIESSQHIEVLSRWFQKCNSLASITLICDANLILAEGCFSGLSNLQTLEIKSGQITIENNCINNCFSSQDYKKNSNSDSYSKNYIKLISKSKVTIGSDSFNELPYLGSVEISGDQVNIGNNCFSLKKIDNFAHSIENIKIHSNNVRIENNCFDCLCSLKSFNIQSKQVIIGKECFKKCDSLSSFSIPDPSEIFLDSQLFEECSNLKNLQLKSSFIIRLGLNCLSNSTGIEKVSLESKEVYIDKGCFFGCSSLAAFQITNCEQIIIMDNAFLGCNKLASASLNALKFTKLGNSCFSECASLQSINLSTPNVEFGDSCFKQCAALTSVLFNKYMYSSTSRATNRVNFQIESVAIGKNCFEGCSSLSSFNLSEVGKVKVDSQVFKDAAALQSVDIAGEKVVIGENCFENCFNRDITVKSNSSVEIGKSCFIGSKHLGNVTFSGGQIILGSDCFNNCTSLKNFTLENFVYVELGANLLTGCNPSYFTATPSSNISLDNYFEYIADLESDDSGRLILVQKKGSDDVFAAKVINKRLQLSYDKNNFLQEMILSTRINYPVIDNVIGFSLKDFNNEDWPTVITKHPGNISLKNAMKNANLSGTQKHIILLGTALGMKYLHSEKIPLNSLTTNKIFLDEEFRPHIKFYGCHGEYKRENYKMDARAFILIAYELITGQPLKDKSNLQLIKDDKIREFFNKCIVSNNSIEFKDILAEFTNEQYSQLFESNDQEIASYLKDFGISHLTIRIKFTNIYYNISRSSLQAEIVGYEKVKDNLSVLEYINFKGSKYNITRIGDHAFTGAQIKKLDFNPNSHVYRIDNAAFENSSLKEISLPPSVEEIGNYCFCGLENLEILHFKGKALTLGKGCFEDCQSLKLVAFECTEDINIGADSFKKCSQLKRFESRGVNISLGESCFSGASALSANEFKCDKLIIEKNCFENCTSLKSFAYKGIKSISIGSKAFYGCCALGIISLTECSIVSFKEKCLSHISKLNQLCVESDEILLGNNMVNCCPSLANINLVSTQSFTISSNAFQGCLPLTDITLMSQSTIQLSKKCFICANNLQIAVIEGHQIIVEDEVFKSLKKLQSITFSCDELKIGNSVFGFCSELYSVMLNNVKKAEFGSNVFTDCTKLSTIRFDATMSLTVGDNCFSGVNSLQNVAILSEKLNIGNNCFKNCRNLSSITFPKAQSIEIGSNAFEGCSKFNSSISITTFSELTIGDDCFKSLESLKYLTLASKKITIGKNAFNECKNLSSIIFNNVLNISIGQGAFSKCMKLDKIFISAVSNVTLSDDCFNSASNIQTVLISGEEINVGSRCFKYCTKLSSVSLTKGKNVTFGSNLFEGSNLKKLSIPDTSKVVLANYCFHHADRLESVTISCEDIDVGERCFNNCKALNSIYIQKVKNATIGPYSFSECYNLTKFTLNAPLNLTICANCFRESCIHEVNLTGGNLTIGDYAFYDSTISSAYITSTLSHIFADNAFFRNGDFRPKLTLEGKKY
ncbi:hypothetical protein M9Y10_030870 [Tritrichomonas musculus]|uniref:BTB domain-containing protein n=1 Tax=Tritrichomonas musculus TaxID=1915356 RepID=A0ABR2H277_9EUKA